MAYPERPDSGFPIYATGTTSHKRNLLVLCQYFGHKKSNFFMLHF